MSARSHVAAIVGGGVAYFALVLACGFALGAIRTVWLVPAMGVRRAELLELPVMVAISYAAARWVARRWNLAARPISVATALGALALTLLIAAELALVLPVRGITLAEYWRERDPVSGAAYLVSIVLFGLMPPLVAGPSRRR